MQPANICPVIALGENFNSVLLKIAFHFAESGSPVWIMSPDVFNKIPEGVRPPDKEVLQLITFMYLKDHKDLISHLNSIHLWHKIPNVVILMGFEKYCNFNSTNYNDPCAALTTTSLLDSAAVCSAKTNKQTVLIVACSGTCINFKDKLQRLVDLYFPNIIQKVDDDSFYIEITEMCK